MRKARCQLQRRLVQRGPRRTARRGLGRGPSRWRFCGGVRSSAIEMKVHQLSRPPAAPRTQHPRSSSSTGPGLHARQYPSPSAPSKQNLNLSPHPSALAVTSPTAALTGVALLFEKAAIRPLHHSVVAALASLQRRLAAHPLLIRSPGARSPSSLATLRHPRVGGLRGSQPGDQPRDQPRLLRGSRSGAILAERRSALEAWPRQRN